MDDQKPAEDPKVPASTQVDPNTLGDEANTPVEPTDPNSEGEDETESEDEA